VDLGLRGRAYLVTGGSRGLGLAAARALVGDGANVVVSGRDQAAVSAAAEQLAAGWPGTGQPGPGRAVGVTADNADPAASGRLVAAATEAFGRLDGALISVGGPPGGTVSQTGDEAWRAAFESVFLGAVRVALAVAAELSRAGLTTGELAAGEVSTGGSIAFVLSTSVRAPIPDLAISNGLRPGLAGVAKSLADELGPQGIRVNGLLPGRIETGRVRALDARRGDPDQVKAELSARIPLRRYGTPAEFGRVAAFVLSPAAGYLNGAMIPVDGGALRSL
jgi:3-oxoacyl-[acyl-carrier protein] reductase